MKIAAVAMGIAAMVLSTGALAAEATIQLPEPDKEGGKPLMQALTERKSQRSFAPEALSDQELSDLLYAAWGVTRPDGRRTAPTAMNIQDITVFVALPDGVYRYDAPAHALELQVEGDLRGECGRQQEMMKSAPAVLVYVSDLDKVRGGEENQLVYPAIHTGAIVQNVYLYCASADLATVVCASVDKERIAELFKLPENWRVQLSQPVGHPAE